MVREMGCSRLLIITGTRPRQADHRQTGASAVTRLHRPLYTHLARQREPVGAASVSVRIFTNGFSSLFDL
jgi:hypothetical protein